MLEKEKILKEGITDGTSTSTEEEGEELEENELGEEEEEGINLSNAAVPTEEEKFDGNIFADDETELKPEATEITEIEATIEPEADSAVPANPMEPAEASATATFTQSQVDEIAGKTRMETREKTLRSVYSRYGVNSEEELDDLVGNAQRFDTLREQYDGEKAQWDEYRNQRDAELAALKESVALLESGIDKNRYEDAKFILKGKGMEVTVENINAELATHPEWKTEEVPAGAEGGNSHFRKLPPEAAAAAQPEQQPAPRTSISVLGNTSADNPQPELTDRERAMRLFKV